MTSCEDTQEQLLAFADGELDPAARALVSHHLAECAACRAEAADLAATLNAVQALPDPALPEAFWDEFGAAVRQRVAGAPAPRETMWARARAWAEGWSAFRPVPAVGLACALGLLLAIGLARAPHHRDVARIDVLAMADSLQIAQNLDVLERFDLLENLDLLEELPAVVSPEFRARMGRS